MLDDVEYLETAFQEARAGRAATLPFSDTEIPTVFDNTLAPEGKHIMSMFTQWVPESWSQEPHDDELKAYAQRLYDRFDAVAPGFKDSILHEQVIGPHEMERDFGLIGGNIFHGELTVDQLFHMRPAVGYADYRTPIKGLVPRLECDARRWGRNWHARPPRGPRNPTRQGLDSLLAVVDVLQGDVEILAVEQR